MVSVVRSVLRRECLLCFCWQSSLERALVKENIENDSHSLACHSSSRKYLHALLQPREPLPRWTPVLLLVPDTAALALRDPVLGVQLFAADRCRGELAGVKLELPIDGRA